MSTQPRSRAVARVLAALIALTLVQPFALVPAAQAATARTSLPVVEQQVMCVVCGIPLADAESAQADRERAYITGLIAKGYTLTQVKGALIVQYGPAVIAQPPEHGFGLVSYLVPLAVAAIVAAAIALALGRWRRRGTARAAAVAAASGFSAADTARLDAELRDFDG